jgi:hypothetical protein
MSSMAQAEIQFDADPGYRLITLGIHEYTVLEVDVTEDQHRQLEALWRIWSRGGRIIQHPDSIAHRAGETKILGFDWTERYAELAPGRMPQVTYQVVTDANRLSATQERDEQGAADAK